MPSFNDASALMRFGSYTTPATSTLRAPATCVCAARPGVQIEVRGQAKHVAAALRHRMVTLYVTA